MATTPVIAVAASKGGVGKTTITLALAAVLADQGKRVLVVDLDPQANASLPLVGDGPAPEFTAYDVLASAPAPGSAADAITPSAWARVDILAADRHLARVETDTDLAVEQRLRKSLDGVTGTYDAVLVDCPPSLGRLAVNGLVAASHVLVVTELGLASLHGVGQTLETFRVVQDAYNPGLRLAGIVPNRAELRLVEQQSRLAELTEAFGDDVWDAVPKRAALAAAYGAGIPITAADAPSTVLDVLRSHADRLLDLTAQEGALR